MIEQSDVNASANGLADCLLCMGIVLRGCYQPEFAIRCFSCIVAEVIWDATALLPPWQLTVQPFLRAMIQAV